MAASRSIYMRGSISWLFTVERNETAVKCNTVNIRSSCLVVTWEESKQSPGLWRHKKLVDCRTVTKINKQNQIRISTGRLPSGILKIKIAKRFFFSFGGGMGRSCAIILGAKLDLSVQNTAFYRSVFKMQNNGEVRGTSFDTVSEKSVLMFNVRPPQPWTHRTVITQHMDVFFLIYFLYFKIFINVIYFIKSCVNVTCFAFIFIFSTLLCEFPNETGV